MKLMLNDAATGFGGGRIRRTQKQVQQEEFLTQMKTVLNKDLGQISKNTRPDDLQKPGGLEQKQDDQFKDLKNLHKRIKDKDFSIDVIEESSCSSDSNSDSDRHAAKYDKKLSSSNSKMKHDKDSSQHHLSSLELDQPSF